MNISRLNTPIFKSIFRKKDKNVLSRNCFEQNKSSCSIKPQKLDEDMFYVRMKTYQKNSKYAKGMILTTNMLSDMVKNKLDFETVINVALKCLKNIYEGSCLARQIVPKYDKNAYRLTRYGRGSEYFLRYFKKCAMPLSGFKTYSPKANREYKDANVCRMYYMRNSIFIFEGWHGDNKNLTLAANAYKKLIKNENPKTEDVVKTAAIIHRLIAQEAPFQRGNESVSNLITKAIFKAYNIQISPLKEGISTDFEAWITDLDGYIKNYPTFFENKPTKRIDYLF